MTKQTVLSRIATAAKSGEAIVLTEEESSLLETGFQLQAGQFQIRDHTPEVAAKQTDPTKDYPFAWMQGILVVKANAEGLTKDKDGNLLVPFSGSVFKPAKGAPDFVRASGSVTDDRLKYTEANAKNNENPL